ncbi:MAG: T9SS type A sorting domain-containing protein [Lewinellaceae bacterium]|nr:T9SS type A sorting domain-containing protein [Saprospiraceae bacterium]MCB9336912.1 T9SS type A sorting domain-containing protein [Lewinellaceae bacterium]
MSKSLVFSLLLLFFTNMGNSLFAQCNPDITAPTPICFIPLDIALASGQPQTILASALDGGSTDNCSQPAQLEFRMEDGTTSASPPLTTSVTYDESDIGTHTVTLWVIDEAGNADFCTTTLHILDDCGGGSSANMTCNDSIIVQIVGGQTANIYPGAILEGGPYCELNYTMGIEPSFIQVPLLSLDETDAGPHTVVVSDNTANPPCWATLIVLVNCTQDTTAPIAICEANTTLVSLGVNQQATLTAMQVDDGSYDNCSAVDFFLELAPASANPPTTTSLDFGINDLGTHDVVLWAVDQSGNASHCTATIDVDDCIGNTTLVCNAHVTVELTSSQPVDFYPADILEGGPYCYDQMSMRFLPALLPLQPYLTFSPGDIGTYTVQVVHDPSDNSCWGTVEVIGNCETETVPPVAVCDAALTIQLSVDGPDLTYLQAIDLNEGSWDNCTAAQDLQFAIETGPPSPSMPSEAQLAFTAVGTYPNVVMWVADIAGNSNFCAVDITVIPPKCNPDQTPPACMAPADTTIHSDDLAILNIDPQNTQQLDQYFGMASAYDFCGLGGIAQAAAVQNNACGAVQLITRTFNAFDNAGNSSTCEQLISVETDYSINIPKDFLPGDQIEELLDVVPGNGTQLGVTFEDVVYDFNCDSLPDLIERTWSVVNWCDPASGLPPVTLPRLDRNNDTNVGDAYVAWSTADSVYLLENGLPIAPLTKYGTIYKYLQILRYNYDDTLQLAVAGQVFIDTLVNCTLDNDEPRLPGWKVKAVGQTTGRVYTATTNQFGLYEINGICPSDTELEVSLDVPMNYGQSCPTTWTVNVPPGMPAVQNIPVQLNNECPLMTVDLAAPFLRRCFTNTYLVDYCNYSAQFIQNAWVEVSLDTFMEFLYSAVPGIALGNNTYSFQIGDLEAGECGSFNIVFELSCDAVLGQTHCSEAHIYPDTLCPQSPQWSGANIEVEGFCQNDSIHLSIKNTGTGNMTAPLDYIVVEDVIMYLNGNFQLNAGQSQALMPIPSTGQTWRLEAQQVPAHPFPGSVAVAVEGCNGLNLTGLVNLFCTENPNPFIAVDCQENIGSFDPNDKSAAPFGYGENHFIERNTDIEYLIRFQNTGTDTAFKVVVLDTLPQYLDPVSVRPGIGSHPFSFEMLDEKVLRFTFDNILLPDSTTNEAASHGFVKFSVKQQPGLDLGTVIENNAAIYFDFNEPVITNTVFHTIGENFIEVINDANERPAGFGDLLVYPNPSSGYVNFEIPGGPLGDGTFVLHDHLGRVVRMDTVAGNRFRFERGRLVPGIYFYSIENEGDRLYSGKIILQ